MERHIGTWFKEGDAQKKEVAELLIEGNSIEFYSRFHGEVFPTTFIGSDGEYSYKVFANGSNRVSSNRLLDYTSAHRVFYVLMQNFEFSKGIDISGVVEFTFSIPELIDWLGISTVFYGSTDMDTMAAGEKNLKPIVIHGANPYIELYFESKGFDSSVRGDDRTEIIIKNEPRIKIQYSQEQDIQCIMDDIECIMQFFGLLIGRVSFAQDIRLSIKDQKMKSWLYFNRDYSYNMATRDILNKPRTYYYVVEDHLQGYYSNWRDFYFDDSFSLLRRIFFAANGKKEIFVEDIFVEYMRILDGYHTRISGDEEKKKKINDALRVSKNEIKKLIFTDEGKPLFEDAIHTVIPEWNANSKHVGDIASWIAAGFLAKTSLSHRMQELDNSHLQIIQKNAVHIEKLKREDALIVGKTDEELIQLYFRELGDTRNYYSHYKLDKTGVLESIQMSDSINVLKATIISIFMSHMDMEKDLICRILQFDSELNFQTMCLREDGELPFEHPSKLNKAIENSNEDQK